MSEEQDNVQPQDENVEVEETTVEDAPEEDVSEEDTSEAEDQPADEEPADEPEAEEVAPVDDKPVERRVHTMPVAKAQEEKRKAVEKAKAETRKEIEAEYAKQGTPDPTTANIEAVAEKHGLDKDAAKELAGAILSQVPKVDTSVIDEIKSKEKVKEEQAQVSSEFDEKVAPLILKDYPSATPEHIAKVKKELSELAFDARYNTYPLSDIYSVRKSDYVFKNGLGAETPGGKGQDVAEFKQLSDSDELKLADRDPETYARYITWLDSQHSKYSS